MNKNRIRLTESQLHRVIKESVKSVLKENNVIDGHMGIDEILTLLGGVNEESYNKLNMILFSLQEAGVITFDEDSLDELYNNQAY